jgi:hypothetical protein
MPRMSALKSLLIINFLVTIFLVFLTIKEDFITLPLLLFYHMLYGGKTTVHDIMFTFWLKKQ